MIEAIGIIGILIGIVVGVIVIHHDGYLVGRERGYVEGRRDGRSKQQDREGSRTHP
jgi:hypothetical protein